VKIYVPAPSSTQSGVNTATQWEVEFENPDQRQLWGNPLMGWTATDDAISNLRLKFPSKESAIAYCKARELDYEVDEHSPNAREQITQGKSYANNFKHKVVHKVGLDVYDI
jgi:NADH dehydrogenase (ubiquinone) Fe-S protein 4